MGPDENTVTQFEISTLEYADDAALTDENVEQVSARVTSIAKRSLEDDYSGHFD